MTSLLSAISGQFTRSLILGAFFPVVLFTVLGLVAVEPLLPRGLPVVAALAELDKEWELLALTFFVVIATGFLYNLNIPIIRFYEGYPWKESFLGQWRIRRYSRIFDELHKGIPRLRLLRDAWKSAGTGRPVLDEITARYGEMYLTARGAYPNRREYVLPTRFGNIIRNFETYPSAEYGVDAVTFWPRLAAIADKDYLAVVEDARSAVDFFINCATLSFLLAALLVAVGFSVTGPQMPVATLIRWPLEAAAALLVGYLFYLGASSRAAAWGATVKGAFDLYRWDLLKKLGYELTPSTREEERRLWRAISQQVIYGDPPSAPPVDYCRPKPGALRTVLATVPAGLGVTLSGGCERISEEEIRFLYRIENTDKDGRGASSVTLTETLPAEIGYVWESARLGGKPCSVTGTNPLVFTLGPLAPRQQIEVEYAALFVAPPK